MKKTFNYNTKSENCANCKRAKNGHWNKGLFFCYCKKGKGLEQTNNDHYEKCPFFKEKNGINNPKPKILQLFCKHDYGWYRAQTLYHVLSGETQYKVCKKCGKVGGKRFVTNEEKYGGIW